MKLRTCAHTTLATFSIAAGALIFTSAPASAFTTHALLSSFGPDGIGVSSFARAESIAVDQSAGMVYVYDREAEGGSIYKFNTVGEPQAFSALLGTPQPDTIAGVGGVGTDEQEIAVDSSNGATKGDIYFADGEGGHVSIYAPSGVPLGELNGAVSSEVPGAPWGEPCGVATDPAGNVYVGLFSGNVNKYTPVGGTVTNADFVASMEGLGGICNITVDGAGNVYTVKFSEGPIVRYPASQFGKPSASGTEVDGIGDTLTVDPSTNDLYVDELRDVAQYHSNGELVDRFAQESSPGEILGSIGVAVYAPIGSSEKIYVSKSVIPYWVKPVEVFGPVMNLPVVSTGSHSGLSGAGSVTFEGTVNPEGTTLTGCGFEYGLDESYGQTVSCEQTPTGDGPVTVEANVTGLVRGTAYHYRAEAANGGGTVYGVDGTFSTFASSDDGSVFASGISESGARLNATVESGSLPTSYHFAYGPTFAYGSVIPLPDTYIPTGSGTAAVTQTVGGLRAGTTYHFAIVTTNPGGVFTGPDETFTTPSVPSPVVDTGSSSGVGQGAVTLMGVVDAVGWDTAYHFEYGTSTSYGASWPTVDTNIGAFNGGQGVAITVQGLQPATLYHYRLVGSSQGGTTYGTDQTFTTSEYPSSVIQESPVLKADLGFINPEPKTGKSTTKSLTRAQKLTNALKTCKRKAKGKRARCERQAHARYGPAKKKR